MAKTSTIYLAHCISPTHEEDMQILKKLQKIDGIDVVSDSRVEFNGKEYCIIAYADTVNPEKLNKIIKQLKDLPDLEDVIELRPVITAQ